MKAAELSAALWDVKDAYIQEALTYKPNKKTVYFLRAAVAACLCIAILGGVFTRFDKAEELDFYAMLNDYTSGDVNISSTSCILNKVKVGEREAVYEYIDCFDDLDWFEENVLQRYIGEKHLHTEDAIWYYPIGEATLQYLICKNNDGKFSLWAFDSFVVSDGKTYTYGDVLSDIYGVNSADDIVAIIARPIQSHKSDLNLGIMAEIGTQSYTNRDEILTFYSIVKDVECYGRESWIPEDYNRYCYSFSTDAVGMTGKVESGEIVYGSRWLEIKLANGARIVSWMYCALFGAFYEYGGIRTEYLTSENVYALNSVFGIH